MNLKKKLQKRCVLMGIFFGVFYSACMTVTTPDGISPLLYFAIMAAFSGPLYGILMYFVLRRQQKGYLNRFPALAEKEVLLEESTIRLSAEKPKSIAGWAFLTSDTLYYAVQSKKHEEYAVEIRLDSVSSLQIDTFNRTECVKLTLTDGRVFYLRFGNASTNWAIKLSETVQAYKAKLAI
ncbi:MAG: hypothetical protein IJW98_01355 [Clostridia bacterium]|nr:hypothetical protein [Clostridia bacterium]